MEIANAAAAAAEAIRYDRSQEAGKAQLKYVEAADWLLILLKREEDANRKAGLRKRLEEYLGRAEAMQKLAKMKKKPVATTTIPDPRARTSTRDHYFSADELFQQDVKRARDAVEKLEAKGVLYRDEAFQGPKALMGKTSKRFSEVSIWRRATDLADKLFDGDPKQREVDQGSLGDCWLLSSLTVLAAFPELVRRLLVAASPKVGVCIARLCYGGEWRLVLIDDLVPCHSNGEPAFAKVVANCYWCSLLEKAVAKFFGSYAALEDGTAAEALALLTGLPTATIPKIHESTTPETIFATMQRAYDAGSIVSASCGHTGLDESYYKKAGLRHAHEYAILRLVQDDDLRLVELRNPWAQFEWKGRWSRGSTEWRTKRGRTLLSKILGKDEAESLKEDDGIFWMQLEDVQKYFHEITICRLRRNFHQHRVSFAAGPTYRGFVIEGDGILDACVVQATERGKYPRGHHVIADVTVCIYKVNDGLENVDFVAASDPGTLAAMTSVEEIQFDPKSAYLVVPFFFNWRILKLQDKLTAVFYSSQRIKVTPVDLDIPTATNALRVAVQNRGTLVSDDESPAILRDWDGITLLENTSSTTGLTMTYSLGQCVNLLSSRHGGVIDSTKGNYVVKDTLPPSSYQISFIRSPYRPSWSISNSHRQWSFPRGPVAEAHHPPLIDPGVSLHSVFPLPSAPR